MPEKYSVGVSTIKMSVIAADGGMGIALVDVGEILEGTASFETGDPNATEFFSEAKDDPIFRKVKSGTKTLKFSIADMTPAKVVLFMGGAASGITPAFKYEFADTFPTLERSFEILTPDGITIQIVRAQVSAKVMWALDGKKIAQVDVTAQVLAPTKAATKSVNWVLS